MSTHTFGDYFQTENQVAETPVKFAIDADSIPASVFGLSAYDAEIAISGRIDRDRAMQVPAVNKSVNLISGSAGSLPLIFVAPDNTHIKSTFFAQPELDIPRSVTMNNTFTDLLLEGVAWWLVTKRDARGYPAAIRRLDPRSVNVTEQGKVYYTRKGHTGTITEWPEDKDLIRFDSPRGPLLKEASRAIRTLQNLEAAAQRFAGGIPPIDILSAKDGVDPGSDDDIKAAVEAYNAAKRAGNGTVWMPHWINHETNAFSPEQLQMADARNHAVLEIARATGVDAEELGVSTTSRSYFNAQDREMHFLKYTMGPFIRAVEDRLSMGDVTPRGYTARFDTEDFLRVDTKTRYETYEIGKRIGAITHEEIREAEHKPMTAAPETVEEINESVENTENFSSTNEPEHITFAAHEFRVDKESRTIEGLIVPFGAKPIDGRDFNFSKGDLKWKDPSRVKMNLNHDSATSFGVATHLEETDRGIVGKFKIAEVPNGDTALSLATSGVWDGLSIGAFKSDDGYLLSHVALTPEPAFEDARTTSVNASADERAMANENENANASAGVNDTGINKKEERTIMEINNDNVTAAVDGPVVIPAAPVVASVKESPLYVFDGKSHEHDLSGDLFASFRFNDGSATQRLEKFMAETFAVDSADVNDVNPTGYRPDLYVDYIEKNAPVYKALYFGDCGATPFTVPAFDSASNLVSDHVEGSEPSGGSFAVKTQLTVTPATLSGMFEITREVIEQGGNPQVSGLIWKQVMRAYAENLETKAAALINGGAFAELGTVIDLTPATGTVGDQAEAALVNAVFIDGAAGWSDVLTHRDLFSKLANENAADGRKRFPSISPQNATGTVSSKYRSIEVNGYNLVPASTLGATGVNNKSFVGDFSYVPFWASAPQRIALSETVAYGLRVGVFGWHAGAVLDVNRVRKITTAA